MGVNVTIQNGDKNAQVLSNGALKVQLAETTQAEIDLKLPFSSFFTDSSGSDEMAVNGSVTPAKYTLAPPDSDKNLYISTITFLPIGNGVQLNRFANITPLSAGCDFVYINNQGELVVASGIKSNYELSVICGNADSAAIYSNVLSNNDGMIQVFDFKERLGYDRGIILKGGTNQRLEFTVNDDLTSVVSYKVRADGFQQPK